jgi:UDP-N-acetylmuramoyl-tripeptide--D-alanyl-D-alanine ligase
MPEPLWTSGEIAAATRGTAFGAGFDASGVSFDTRTLQPGDLFVALAGERDGHEFAQAAFDKGAAGALTSRPVARGPYVQVADTLAGLETLGAAARDRSPARRGAVTGSVGKTSVTQAVKLGLELAGRAHGSIKSFNNQIGVPLTLARMPRDTERAVFEIGMNHAGEIDPLSRMVRPHVVAITTVGPVHTENFPDGETGVARAKAEIFAGLEPGGAAILNADNAWFDLLKAEADAHGARILRFGAAQGSDARLVDFQGHADGSVVKAELHGRPLDIALLQTGAHWGPNSLAVLLMLEELGVGLDTGLEALSRFAPLEGRGVERRIDAGRGGFTLIDESYNANPLSMRAVIQGLGERKVEGRRIVALTDMLELGADSAKMHADLAQPIEAADVDIVFCAGPMMKSLWDALPAGLRGGYAPDAEALAHLVVDAVAPGDVVMVKGSNGSKASAVAAALKALEAPSGGAG